MPKDIFSLQEWVDIQTVLKAARDLQTTISYYLDKPTSFQQLRLDPLIDKVENEINKH